MTTDASGRVLKTGDMVSVPCEVVAIVGDRVYLVPTTPDPLIPAGFRQPAWNLAGRQCEHLESADIEAQPEPDTDAADPPARTEPGDRGQECLRNSI